MMSSLSRFRERAPMSPAKSKVFVIFLLLVSIFAYMQLYSKYPIPISGVVDFTEKAPVWTDSSGNIISGLLGWNKINLPPRDPPFKILFWTTWYGYEADTSSEFVIPECSNEFIITSNKSELGSADALIFQFVDLPRRNRSLYLPTRDINVPWILAFQEAANQHPLYGRNFDGLFNWTWSSRSDSLIHPNFTEMFSKYEEPDPRWVYGSQFSMEFLRNKTSSAWVTSNCQVIKSERNELVSNLSKLGIAIDRYGKCATSSCPKGEECFEMLGKRYKFYLALENALCEGYITEKINHGLLHGMVPIVYALGNVGRNAPPNSYINVLDFPTLSDLADRLKYLDNNTQEYFKYFEWRQYYNATVKGSPLYQCHTWRKIKEFTMKLGTEEDSKFRHTYVNFDEWHSKFYNPTLGKLCEVCLDPKNIKIQEPSLNRQIMYNDYSRCLENHYS